MKKIKILLVPNSCPWPTLVDKIDEIKSFFSSKVELNVDVINTNYPTIPFVQFNTTLTNAPKGSSLLQVDPRWYDYNITPMGARYDIVLFVVNMKQWPDISRTFVRGARTDRDQGPVELQIGADENEGVYQNGVLKFKTFQHFAEHEIMHALFMMSGQSDPTHHWDYDMNNLAGALNELIFPTMNTSDTPTLTQRILAPLTKPSPTNSLLALMCEAIQSKEGWITPGQNPDYPNGSPSFRNCNPGNLRYAGQIGSVGIKNGFAVFPDYQTGLDALKRQILLVARGKSNTFLQGARDLGINVQNSGQLTIGEFFKVYAPVKDKNDPVSYAAYVAGKMGVPVSFSISGLLA